MKRQTKRKFMAQESFLSKSLQLKAYAMLSFRSQAWASGRHSIRGAVDRQRVTFDSSPLGLPGPHRISVSILACTVVQVKQYGQDFGARKSP
jgi:hypothetical protein